MKLKPLIVRILPSAGFTLVALALQGMGASAALGQGLPRGLESIAGDVSASTVGQTMTITQGQQRGVAQWQSFSIDGGHTVNIQQPGASSVLLNRVVGGDLSRIAGELNANGQVYLVNPAGVTFAEGARVDVGGIVATTLDTPDQDFLDGGKVTLSGNSEQAVTVESGATIRARGADGAVALIGAADVVNAGEISAGGGAALASGGQIEIDPYGDGLTTLRIAAPSQNDAAVANEGNISVAGGRVHLGAHSVRSALVSSSGTIAAGSVASDGGKIRLEAQGSDDDRVEVQGLVDAGSDEARGGSIEIESSGDVIIQGQAARVDANGIYGGKIRVAAAGSAYVHDGASVHADGRNGDGGSVEIRSSGESQAANTGAVGLGGDSTVSASATGDHGDGGQVDLIGKRAVQAHGTVKAHAGSYSGDGGKVETSADWFDTRGLRVDASAPGGQAGTWVLDPMSITIAHGASDLVGIPDLNPFDPDAPGAISTIWDGDISQTLQAGNNVTITTGVNSQQPSSEVTFDSGVAIQGGAQATTFRVEAGGDIWGFGQPSIQAGSGPLNVEFEAGLGGQGSIFFNGNISTGGGNVQMRGRGRGIGFGEFPIGIGLWDATISSGSGNISLVGTVADTAQGGGAGVELTGGSLTSTNGAIRVHGAQLDSSPNAMGDGVSISGTQIQSGNGLIDLAGSTNGVGTGVYVAGGQSVPFVFSGSHVVLRGSAEMGDAIVLDGLVGAGAAVNVRPATVTANGTVQDQHVPINVGSGADGAFTVAGDILGNIQTPAVVLGGGNYGGQITVVGDLGLNSTTEAITLQSIGPGGRIHLAAPLSAPTVGLISAGNITQLRSAPVVANSVLARSVGADVRLDSPGNNAATNTVGGGAAGRFIWVDVDDVSIGSVSAPMFVGTSVGSTNADGLVARNVRVQSLGGSIRLSGRVVVDSGGYADLVSAASFSNNGGSITGPWRIWQPSWAGEQRNGLVGSGALPNLYGCAFDGPCQLDVADGDNHFVYAARPSVMVSIDDAERNFGEPNPPFGYTVTGLRPGDSTAVVAGDPSTGADESSAPGNYAITGDGMSSPAGYELDIRPGNLEVRPGGTPPGPGPDPDPDPDPGPGPDPDPGPGPDPDPDPGVGKIPVPPRVIPLFDWPVAQLTLADFNSYTFDRNLSTIPICVATGPLLETRTESGTDILAREWSRVRDRPNLTNCIDTQSRNTCNDF